MMKNKHSFKEWLIAVRPWSFPASAMPVVVTLAYLYWKEAGVDWLNGVWALVNIVCFHAAGNTWSDYFDYKRRVDAKDIFGVKTLTGGMFTPQEIYALSWTLLCVALAMGIGLLWRTGLPLLYVGVGGLLCSLLYPALKYRAWGDVVIFFAYALLPTLGTSYAVTLSIDLETLYLALPVGLITVAILHANNTRDIATDHRAGIRTLAMILGGRASSWIYCVEILFPFGWLTGCVVGGTFPVWCLLVWLAFIPAWVNVRMAVSYLKFGADSIARLDEMTAKLQLLFSLLFSLSFLLAGLLS